MKIPTYKFHDDVRICSDCFVFQVSGDMSYLALHDDEEETIERVEHGADQLTKKGLVFCPPDSEPDDEEIQSYFSNCICDLCDQHLAGDRYDGKLFKVVY